MMPKVAVVTLVFFPINTGLSVGVRTLPLGLWSPLEPSVVVRIHVPQPAAGRENPGVLCPRVGRSMPELLEWGKGLILSATCFVYTFGR